MVQIRGHYINLETAVSRRQKIEKHLKQLSWGYSYSRFRAETSNDTEASKRGLTKGEYGLWKSWIKLLKNTIESADIQSYDYLHILEDDAILNQKMIEVLDQLDPTKYGIELLATEMYANEEIWRSLIETWKRQTQKRTIGILLLFTGCASSVLIPSKSVKKIYEELKKEYKQSEILLPIDNTIVKLENQKRLRVGCTFPFLSSIDQELIADSNIQSFEQTSSSIILTQQINGLLRKQLSVETDDKDYNKITTMLVKLASSRDNTEYVIKLLKAALEIAQKEDLFRYRVDPRLKGEANNPQNDLHLNQDIINDESIRK